MYTYWRNTHIARKQAVDITDIATLGEQFPHRLMQLAFRLMQVVDEQGRDQYRYIMPPLCEVPVGTFLMGSDWRHDPRANDNESPQHPVSVPAFQIAMYPLTVMEYACFVQATDRRVPTPAHSSWLPNLSLQEQVAERPDHPIVNISWRDALEYAEWLSESTGERWRLPSEAEWEKAARGTDGRIYPWGNDRNKMYANTAEGEPHTTTPIGSYPQNISPHGAFDMAGNVWEWTSTVFKPYPYLAFDGREEMRVTVRYTKARVFRGGSWNVELRDARAARRAFHNPKGWRHDIGVRLVLGPAQNNF
jgi:toxoflavin biosynthesis protein ToxD